jgi:Rrf2 family protein
MKLSTRSRYGTRAMLDIALHSEGGPTMLKDIADRQSVSLKYLDHILAALRKAGLIKNIRGKGGGYVLTRLASHITVNDIVKVVEGSIAPVECVENPDLCNRSSFCATREVWQRLHVAMEHVLESTTIEQLVDRVKAKKPSPVNFSI